MSSKSLHFKDAPSIEAIFLIRSTSVAEMSFEDFEERCLRIVDNTFSRKRKLSFNDLEFITKDEDKVGVRSSSGWLGIEYSDSQNNVVIRLQKDGISYHKLKPYTSYTEILPLIQRVWEKYCENFAPNGISKIGLRFVNRINLPDEISAEKLSDYLSVVPHVKLPLEANIKNILSRVHVESNSLNGYISFSNISSSNQQIEAVILDIDTWKDQYLPVDSPTIWENFFQLRTFKNELFLESLTEKCLSSFN